MTTRGQGRIFQAPGSPFWWIAYCRNGKEHREAARHIRTGLKLEATEKLRHEAERFLKHRLGELTAEKHGGPAFVSPVQQRMSVNELVDALAQDYALRGKASPQFLSHLKPIRQHFGEWRAVQVTAEAVDAFIGELTKQEYTPASINRTTQLLGQAFRLAVERKHLADAPKIRHLSEKGNERKGFFEAAEVRAVIANLSGDLADFVLFAFLTGWRKGEISSLAWSDIDGDTIRLRAENAKTGYARSVPIEGELAELIERRRTARKLTSAGVTMLCDLVFHRGGAPILEFRKSWKTACRMAGVSGRRVHDIRRTVVRDLIRAGVSETVAMSLSGHRTRSMLDRYNITTERDQREDYRQQQEQRVVSIQ